MPNGLSYMLFHILFEYVPIFEKQKWMGKQIMTKGAQNIFLRMSHSRKTQIKAKSAGI